MKIPPLTLGDTQLNAQADVPGSMVYSPVPGTMLEAGLGQVLTVTFTPADTANYEVMVATVRINVLPANQPPTAGADEWSTLRRQPAGIDAASLLANDTDPDACKTRLRIYRLKSSNAQTSP